MVLGRRVSVSPDFRCIVSKILGFAHSGLTNENLEI
jgi:hypothetical protein